MLVSDLYVHPLRRGRGWASELMTKLVRHADRAGVDLWLYTQPFGNTRGAKSGRRLTRLTTEQLKGFYEGFGFVRCHLAGYDDEMIRRCRG